MSETWLSPYFRPYLDAYGEVPSPQAIKRMARAFKQLETVNAREEIVKRFGHYCTATPIRFYSVERFAETFPGWKEPDRRQGERRNPLEPLPGETTDEYIARQAQARR